MRNVTISAWSFGNVVYSPRDCGWKLNTTRGASGCFRSCTSAITPSATILFTGIEVYYVSTYFEGQSVHFRLDGVPMPDVSLSPPAGISANSNTSKVLWSIVGLRNTAHILELFPGHNRSTLIVDTILYTTNNVAESSIMASQSMPGVSSATNTPMDTSHMNAHIGLVVGSIIGSISSLIFLGLTIMMCRRRQRLNANHHRSSTNFETLPGHLEDNFLHQRTSNNVSRRFSVSLPQQPLQPIRPLPAIPLAGPSTSPLAPSQSLRSDLENPCPILGRNVTDPNAQSNPSSHGSPHDGSPPTYIKFEPVRNTFRSNRY